jgi:hypothetical protein
MVQIIIPTIALGSRRIGLLFFAKIIAEQNRGSSGALLNMGLSFVGEIPKIALRFPGISPTKF